MMMWRLWKGLKHPTCNHPMFVRVQADIYDDETRFTRLIQNIFLQGQIWLWPLLFIIDMRLVCLMALGGSISGIILALRISNQIAGEQHSRTYDLLCLTPGGTIRTLWAMCTGCLHREDAFEILNSNEAWIVRLGLFVPFIVSSQLLLERLLNLPQAISLLWGLGFVLLYLIDHIQSTLFGCIVGMLSAQIDTRIDTRLWAFMAFMGFQIGSYLLTAVGSILTLPLLYPLLNAIGISAELGQIVLITLLFYGIRNQLLTRAWQRLLIVTHTNQNELDFLTPSITRAQMKLHDDVQTVARA